MSLDNDLVQLLIDTRTEHPLDDDFGKWVARAQSETVFTRRQAEFFVYHFGTDLSQADIADAMGISEPRATALKHEIYDVLADVERTLALVYDLRDEVRPQH